MKITKEDLRKIVKEELQLTFLNEAEEIDFNKLDPQRKKQVMAFEKIIEGKTQSIFQGIHGYIVYIDAKGIAGKYRFSDDVMKKLLSAKARWVEGGDGTVSVGF